jgi:hypothetical protein
MLRRWSMVGTMKGPIGRSWLSGVNANDLGDTHQFKTQWVCHDSAAASGG